MTTVPVDAGIAAVVDQLQVRLDALPPEPDPRRAFLGTYVRMTTAIGEALAAGVFEDPGWVRRWDVAFAGLFLAAHDADATGGPVPRPWRLAFAAGPALPPLVHVLVELNAHVNWDLPQALLAVVDDDRAVRDSLRRSLEFNGYTVELASDGAEALARVPQIDPDAIIMDVMMPRLDGLEATRALRGAGNDVPILVLTARAAVSDRVDGLDAGADDYLTKPFALDELLARLRALLRRVHPDGDEPAEVLAFSDLSLDLASREVRRGDRLIELTRTEFALLEMFLRRPRRVLERAFILEEVWGFDFPTTANSLEVYVGYLRRKTEAEDEARLIHTVRGVGYVLREAQ